MSDIAIEVMKYLKNNSVSCPFDLSSLNLNYELNMIFDAVQELANYGYLDISKALDSSYIIVKSITSSGIDYLNSLKN